MFDYENVNYSDVQRASDLFHRDGFVVIHDALTPSRSRSWSLSKKACPKLLQS